MVPGKHIAGSNQINVRAGVVADDDVRHTYVPTADKAGGRAFAFVLGVAVQPHFLAVMGGVPVLSGRP